MKLAAGRGALVFGEVIYAPGGTCGPRIQQDYQLVVIHRGSLELHLDEQRIEVPAGHGILLEPGHREHFLFSTAVETHHSWCAISPSAVPSDIRCANGVTGVVASFSSHLASLLKLAKSLPVNRGHETELANGYGLGLGLALLFGFALEVLASQRMQAPGDEVLGRMDAYISREYARPLQLADIAVAAGVSRQHLLKLCRDRHRPTPTQSLYERRIEIAADHLSRTGLSIGEIATRCGFANAFHFSRKFARAYGTSPSLWRKQAWSMIGKAAAKTTITAGG